MYSSSCYSYLSVIRGPEFFITYSAWWEKGKQKNKLGNFTNPSALPPIRPFRLAAVPPFLISAALAAPPLAPSRLRSSASPLRSSASPPLHLGVLRLFRSVLPRSSAPPARTALRHTPPTPRPSASALRLAHPRRSSSLPRPRRRLSAPPPFSSSAFRPFPAHRSSAALPKSPPHGVPALLQSYVHDMNVMTLAFSRGLFPGIIQARSQL